MTSNGKRICKNCGYEVPADMKQCPHCGWLLDDEDDFVLPSLDEDKSAQKKQTVQRHQRVERDETYERPSQHASRSYPQNNSYDDYYGQYQQTSDRPKPRHAEPGAFTDLDVKDLPIQETAEMKKLEQEEAIETKQYDPSREQRRSLEDTLFDPNEHEEETERKTAPKSRQEPETHHRNNKKHHSVLPAILLFIVLTLALLAGGIYLVDHFTGGSIVSDLKGKLTNKTAAVTAAPKETVEATAAPTVTPTPTPAPTAAATANAHEGYVGHLKVTADAVRIRDSASLSGNEVGSAATGQEYEVIATSQADGYTWYEIGENQWMPSDGTWAEYTQY